MLIADSGSTKTHWALVEQLPGQPKTIRTAITQGLNPLHVSAEEITATLRQVLNQLCPVSQGRKPQLDELRFYGSGCTPALIPVVEQALRAVLTPMTRVSVQSDLMGAALALTTPSHVSGFVASSEPFIACILGTGAIASLYEPHEKRLTPMPALGYILGDEGSGAWFGRHLLSDYLKGQMSERAREAFEEDFGVITPQSAIQHVYQQPCPNRYLATFAAFLGRHLDIRYSQELAFRGIDSFWRRNVMRVDGIEAGEEIRDVRLVGSVAWGLKSVIEIVAESHGYVVTQVIKDPIQGLV